MTKTKTRLATVLEQALSPRADRALTACGVRTLRREHRAIKSRYSGGLKAEQQSAEDLLKRNRQLIREHVLRRHGRGINLAAMLGLKKPDGKPVWTIVDPRQKISLSNGGQHHDGTIGWGGNWIRIDGLVPKKTFEPVGMPALPPRVRDLIGDKKIAKRAKRIGVLYQPEQWREVDPDPALIVEWNDLLGEYYALAVWGVDGPRIMEFVD